MILYTIWDAFNGQYLIGDGIGEGFNSKGGQYFELFANNGLFVWLAVCGWIVTQSQYRGIDDTPTEKKQLIIGWYSTQEETHSTGGFQLEMALEKGSMAKTDNILNCC